MLQKKGRAIEAYQQHLPAGSFALTEQVLLELDLHRFDGGCRDTGGDDVLKRAVEEAEDLHGQ